MIESEYFDKPIDDAIMDALLHLPVAGDALQMAAYQVRLQLKQAGYEIRKAPRPAAGGYKSPPEIASTSTAKADATREVIDADAVWNVPDEAIQKAWAENRLEIDLDDYGSPKLTADNVLRIYQSVVNHAFFIPPQAAT